MERIILLVVDESLSAREIIRYALENSFSKIEIDEASNSREAKEKLEHRQYDFILCDWESPAIKGDKLLQWMRKHPALNTTPFIMLTSKNDRSYIMKALQSGVNSYLVKPFTVVGLIHRVMSVITKLDRREFERYASDSPVCLKFQKHKLNGNLIDISLGGLLGTFHRRESFPQILERVIIDIEPDYKTKISGIHGFIVRIQAAEKTVDSKYINIAVKFLNISSEIKKELNNFLNILKIKI